MIRSLRGRLGAVDADGAIVEVGGVGLFVRLSATTGRRLPGAGAPVELETHLIVREDALDLYGFASPGERELFGALVSVSGVGPRLALAICGLAEPHELREAVARGDAAVLQGASGVGRRTAERVIVELRDRLPPIAARAGGDALPAFSAAREGLIGLGFGHDEIAAALTGAPGELDGEGLLRHALAKLRR